MRDSLGELGIVLEQPAHPGARPRRAGRRPTRTSSSGHTQLHDVVPSAAVAMRWSTAARSSSRSSTRRDIQLDSGRVRSARDPASGGEARRRSRACRSSTSASDRRGSRAARGRTRAPWPSMREPGPRRRGPARGRGCPSTSAPSASTASQSRPPSDIHSTASSAKPASEDAEPEQQFALLVARAAACSTRWWPGCVRWRSGRSRAPPTSSGSAWSSRSTIAAGVSTRTRAAASSRASGAPSSAAQIAAIAPAFSSVELEVGLDRPGALHEQVGGRPDGQRPELDALLAADPQQDAARGEHRRPA